MKRSSITGPLPHLKCELAAEILSSFGNLRFRATGWSMLPTIWPGDTLVVQRVSADQVCVGDVVLVKRQGRFCAHRVIEAGSGEESHLVTQGDGMHNPDPPVRESELLGRVSYVIREGKCIEVPPRLGLGALGVALAVQRSVFIARALVWLHELRGLRDKPGTSASLTQPQT